MLLRVFTPSVQDNEADHYPYHSFYVHCPSTGPRRTLPDGKDFRFSGRPSTSQSMNFQIAEATFKRRLPWVAVSSPHCFKGKIVTAGIMMINAIHYNSLRSWVLITLMPWCPLTFCWCGCRLPGEPLRRLPSPPVESSVWIS
jgi:hypothetical protein